MHRQTKKLTDRWIDGPSTVTLAAHESFLRNEGYSYVVHHDNKGHAYT